MLSIRVIAASAVSCALAVAFVAAPAGVRAQTATDAAPGKPIPLLQILAKPEKTKTKPHLKRVSKAARKIHLATVHRRLAAARTAPAHSAIPAASHAADAPAPAPAAAVAPWPETPPAAAAAPAVPAAIAPDPSQITVAGQTVQIVSSDEVSDIDRAASEANAAPVTPAAATTTASTDIDKAQPPAPSMVAATVMQAHSEVGSASWIAQILAALGGAGAAGFLAWFLMGSTPQRTYG